MDRLTQRLKNTAFLRAFTFLKIPLIWALSPSVIELGSDRTVVQIKLRRKTKNHLGSMYFGAIAIGSELVVALKAVHAIHLSGKKIDFVFKDFQIEFHKRAEGNVHFICDQGTQVKNLVEKAIESRQRETQTFEGYAVVPSISQTEKVATFKVTLSVKSREKIQH